MNSGATPHVLSYMGTCKLKLDEEKLKYAGQTQQNGFAPADFATVCWGLYKAH